MIMGTRKTRKTSKNSVAPILITVILMMFIVAVIWSSQSGKISDLAQKDSCDYKFLQWCKDNPGVGDYDNFGNTDRACIGQGSYRTCDQVMEALS